MRFIQLFTLLIVAVGPAHAQGPVSQSRSYPRDYFRQPLDLPPQASGTFAELRSNHFHGGSDYRTQQRIGHPLHAIGDGYISRARVQLGGGGNALYITHPNGYTSVYMHMHVFNERIAAAVREQQYREQRFDVDVRLEPKIIPVKKGDIIGQTGNSGSSQGPHLHLEIRDTESEEPINPQLFGLEFPDNIPPAIQGITVYDLGDESFSEHTPRRHLQVSAGNSGQYALAQNTVIPINGRTGIGIVTSDKHNGSPFSNGVYSIELLLDGKPIYHAVFERFGFTDSRALNSHIDYPYYILKRTRIQKSFVDPNNPLEIYKQLVNDGVLVLTDNEVHQLMYRVRDVRGNTSTLGFSVQHNTAYQPERKRTPGTVIFNYDKENRYTSDHLQITVPENSLYDQLHFSYAQGTKPAKGYSLMQHVHNRMIPVHRGYQLAIKPDETLPVHLYGKALIVDSRGNSQGGRYEDGWVRTTAYSFGSFYVGVDTIAPTIRPQNISEGKNMATLSRMNLLIGDDLSGIQQFNGYLDDQWVLMEYDPKAGVLWHVFEPGLSKGKHHFRLEVVDWKDNKQVYEVNFLR
ncbi:M23 family metallopeptidase [Parapedobacter lycopersici]|uniref:M23 family metallopeptidase n=1 Tax=Parapedobacter lycopersici TaxID=1864939 RepID=UPI00214DE9BB|nr:M23 family metallopeptidase [Parapedobacter lycopersici]